jgi:hypothetical protein
VLKSSKAETFTLRELVVHLEWESDTCKEKFNDLPEERFENDGRLMGLPSQLVPVSANMRQKESQGTQTQTDVHDRQTANRCPNQ